MIGNTESNTSLGESKYLLQCGGYQWGGSLVVNHRNSEDKHKLPYHGNEHPTIWDKARSTKAIRNWLLHGISQQDWSKIRKNWEGVIQRVCPVYVIIEPCIGREWECCKTENMTLMEDRGENWGTRQETKSQKQLQRKQYLPCNGCQRGRSEVVVNKLHKGKNKR